MSYTEHECIARIYCGLAGLDPDERIRFPHPKGYAVAVSKPRYMVLADRAADLMRWAEAIDAYRAASDSRATSGPT
jgi:hypothetical protein